jgi:hypothetical protein
MTVAEFIAELQKYDPGATIVVTGYEWLGCDEPQEYEDSPELWPENGGKKVVIRSY